MTVGLRFPLENRHKAVVGNHLNNVLKCRIHGFSAAGHRRFLRLAYALRLAQPVTGSQFQQVT